MSSHWKSVWKSECPIFALNRWVHSAARTFSGPPISLLTRLRISVEFDLRTACGIEKVSYRCLAMNLYSFVSITRPKFLSTWQKVVPREFWRFLTLYEAFISTLRLKLWNRLFGGNSGCVYPLAFFHKLLRILHYCRRGNSGFQHADKSIRAIFDQSEHFKLRHVCRDRKSVV